MTPLEIEVLIHCHVCPAPHPRLGAPAVAEAIERFERNGIIVKKSLKYRTGVYYPTTDRGKALVRILCSTPFPEQRWVDQNGNIIDV